MIYDCKKMDLYRVVVGETNIQCLDNAIRGILELKTLNQDETHETGNSENMPISEQVECTLEAHGNKWPEAYPIYYTSWRDHRPTMEIAWFRFIEKRKE